MPTSPGQSKERLITWKIDYNACSLPDLQKAQDHFFLLRLKPYKIATAFKYKQVSKPAIAARTRLSVDRAVDRPLPLIDRSVDRVPNRELGAFSRSTGRSTEL